MVKGSLQSKAAEPSERLRFLVSVVRWCVGAASYEAGGARLVCRRCCCRSELLFLCLRYSRTPVPSYPRAPESSDHAALDEEGGDGEGDDGWVCV